MGNLQLTQAPTAKAEMLIRKPVAEVLRSLCRSGNYPQVLVHQEYRASGNGQAHCLDVGNV